MGTQKVQTSPYHLQTNGQCERFNSTLINMLGTLPKEKKSEWKNHIGTLVHAYNCTQLQGSAPAFSCLGDNLISLAPHTITEPNTTKFVQKIWEHTRWAQKRLRQFRLKKHSQISTTMTSKVGQQPWKLGTWF